MSAILSSDDLNDFISPGVACIKPVETLPLQKPADIPNPYEVTTEDKLPAEPPPPAQITLTDCLACSGCVTSAEAVLVSLQSHSEVLHALDSNPPLLLPGHLHSDISKYDQNIQANRYSPAETGNNGKLFVASVSPQVRASLAVTYGTTEQEAGWMIEQLLCGPPGLRTGGNYGNEFTWVVDTNAMREASLVLGAQEVLDSTLHLASVPPPGEEGLAATKPKRPILTSACPGWICYAEKTHPHILPHLSRLKSPQSLTGILLKTVLSKTLNIDPSQIWHLAIMPCFDKKLEASRKELTDAYWRPLSPSSSTPVRDVDCVITARELLMLAETRAISYPSLPREPLSPTIRTPFPDHTISDFLYPLSYRRSGHAKRQKQPPVAGTSGGYLHHTLLMQQALYPGSTLQSTRGRNADVVDYTLTLNEKVLFHAARYYGFRNIQNLVRKLKPPKQSRLGKVAGVARRPGAAASLKAAETEYMYVEVMACPGGCTNGGGQIKIDDLGPLQGIRREEGQKEWLARVDEAYFSMEEDECANDDDELKKNKDAQGDIVMDDATNEPDDMVNGISARRINGILDHWSQLTGIERDKLVFTSYRAVDSDVGKSNQSVDRVIELVAGKAGGGW